MAFAQKEEIKQKVYLSNVMAFIVAFGIALPFTFISSAFFPVLTYIPVWGLGICLTIPFINKLGGIHLSRVILSLVPLGLATAYQAGLMHGDEPVASIYTIQLSFALLPFILFDLRESGKIITTSSIAFLPILGESFWDSFISYPLDTDPIRHGILSYIAGGIAVILAFSVVYLMGYFNLRLEKGMLKLKNESDERTEELENARAEMQRTIQELEKAREEEKNRNWVTQGLNEVDKVVKQVQDTEEIYDRVLQTIVKYLGANQGALYLVETHIETDDKYLQPKSVYAWGRKKLFKEKIAIGEGLVGQCYLEREAIYLTEIPEAYVTIKSGLGYANPRSLHIAPMLHNEEVQAVLEIASFEVLNTYERQFIEEICENLASTIFNQKVNERTRLLYEESQLQTEQMRSQEEEMRQSMEELQATQEQQARLEQELKTQLSASEEAQLALQEKEKALQEAQEKSQKRALAFRDKMEALDMQLEQRNAELHEVKRAFQQSMDRLEQNTADKVEWEQLKKELFGTLDDENIAHLLN